MLRLVLLLVFGWGIWGKLTAPAELLQALTLGLGLREPIAQMLGFLVLVALVSVVLCLMIGPDVLAMGSSAVFFLVGAGYVILLANRGYSGDCGCGVRVGPQSLWAHAGINALMATCCLAAIPLTTQRRGSSRV